MRGGGVQALILAIVLVVIFVVFAVAAFSQSTQRFVIGERVSVSDTMLCDTADQLAEILVAFDESPKEGRVVYMRLNRLTNAIGDPVCALIRPNFMVEVVPVASHGEIGGLHIWEVEYPQLDSEAWVTGFIASRYPLDQPGAAL